MHRVDVGEDRLKQAAALLAERAGRLLGRRALAQRDGIEEQRLRAARLALLH